MSRLRSYAGFLKPFKSCSACSGSMSSRTDTLPMSESRLRRRSTNASICENAASLSPDAAASALNNRGMITRIRASYSRASAFTASADMTLAAQENHAAAWLPSARTLVSSRSDRRSSLRSSSARACSQRKASAFRCCHPATNPPNIPAIAPMEAPSRPASAAFMPTSLAAGLCCRMTFPARARKVIAVTPRQVRRGPPGRRQWRLKRCCARLKDAARREGNV